MADKSKSGDIAAHNVDEKNANRFDVLKCTSVPYTSQEKCELACDGLYYTMAYWGKDLHVIYEMTRKLWVQYFLVVEIKVCRVPNTKDLHLQEKIGSE